MEQQQLDEEIKCKSCGEKMRFSKRRRQMECKCCGSREDGRINKSVRF